jgi:LuxR family maltose regulon positive regulatory protein
LARLKAVAGEPEPAQQLLHALIAQIKQPHLLREVSAGQAWLALMDGNLAAVQRWSTTAAQPAPDLFLAQQEREAFIVARMLIAQGEPEAARHLLNPWQADAKAQGRGRSELEALMLKALAFFTANNLPQARQTLSQALTLAHPEGYRRLFLDEGEKLAALLRATLPHFKEAPWFSYGHSLLHDFTLEPAPGSPSSSFELTIQNPKSKIQNLLEPLTPREHQVLRLMAAGLSNPEIAETLIVSLNTIKTQVKSIYRKLDVHTRDDACDLARRLKLL